MEAGKQLRYELSIHMMQIMLITHTEICVRGVEVQVWHIYFPGAICDLILPE